MSSKPSSDDSSPRPIESPVVPPPIVNREVNVVREKESKKARENHFGPRH